jgi:hypothetical protein
LVKEEKILLQAQEGGETEIMDAVADVVESCTFGKLDVSKLPSFDLEYIFLKIRSKAVGEKVTLNLPFPGDENVKVFPTIQISPNSQFGQSIGITEPVNTETKLELVDGTFSYRDLMNNYARYANEPQLQQSYYLSLQKQLTPAQFQILNIHLIQAGLIQAQ